VIAAACARTEIYLAENRRLGRDNPTSGIIAAMMVPGMQRVVLTSPPADVVCDPTQAPRCTGITFHHGGYDE